MASSQGPTVRKWELAGRLRELRDGSGLSLEDVARELLCSPSKISRIETATSSPSARDVRDLARLYDVPPETRDELMELAREAKKAGWWKSYDEVAARSSTYIGLEDAARAIRQYDTILMPGLLQTPAYTRALMRRILPRLNADGVEQYVLTRQARYEQVLRSPSPPSYWAVLDESVLARQVGDESVMQDQIRHLLRCIDDQVVTLQIVPFSSGAHVGMEGPFTILEFDVATLSDVVYTESRTGQIFLNRLADLTLFRETFDYLRASASSPDDSAAALTAMLRP